METRPLWTAPLKNRRFQILAAFVVLALLWWMRPAGGTSAETDHPIHHLISEASEHFSRLITQQTHGAPDAARAYRTRRGRHPPPYFDQWVEWAEQHDAPIYEWMFDQIYEDLEPFWAVEPGGIRADATSWPHVLTVRGGVVRERSVLPRSFENWIGRWREMVEMIPGEGLPDVDLALNPDDEPHIFVAYESVERYVKDAGKTRRVRSVQDVEFISEYSTYDPIPAQPTFTQFPDAPSEDNLWLLARDTCVQGTEARFLTQDDDFTTPPQFPSEHLPHMPDGYISNYTASKSVCGNPHLRNLIGYFVNAGHGSLIYGQPDDSPPDRLTTRSLFPLFSVTKLQSVNNDILVPSPMYWGSSDYANADAHEWEQKADHAIWRGSASGGFNNETNWTRFHRHRFVSMSNGTQVALTLAAAVPGHVPGGDPPLPHNFPRPNPSLYPLGALESRSPRALGRWIDSFSAATFVNLICWPPTDFFKNDNGRYCAYTTPFYNTSEWASTDDTFRHKYLPDIDGMSYSGRWRSFLASNSLPIKATVWSEWHDARLVPWKHFVPMDSTMVDWWGIMEFFVGYRGEGTARRGHDGVARGIAEGGREWARRVLRREDMVLYFWRLILEYARVCDEARERMAWVGDLE